jgi:cytochrome c biogenesis protein CcdA
VPGLWLARARSVDLLASFTVGVFGVYLTGGLVMLFGPGRALIAAFRHLAGPLEHSLEAAVGVLALGFAIVLWRRRGKTGDQRRRPRLQSRVSAFALGAGIMAIELPTAFMYFGAISAILAARRPAAAEISLVTAYNALFVAPLMALLAIRRLTGPRSEQWIVDAEARVRRLGQLALTGVVIAGGAALVAIGLDGLA